MLFLVGRIREQNTVPDFRSHSIWITPYYSYGLDPHCYDFMHLFDVLQRESRSPTAV